MTNNMGPRQPASLDERIDAAAAKAKIPGYATAVHPDGVDVAAWNHVGDPLAEALITQMRERRLMSGDIYANARLLEFEKNQAAQDFFADVEHVPGWCDFDAMHAGAAMTSRNPVGLVMGMHGALPFTYVDPATAAVMGSTGRLSGRDTDFERRFWETATGFIGAMDVDEMKPGGNRWEQWVRIRLLHTMIRLGILRSGRWNLDASMPISQAATASGAHIFGTYRANIIKALGGYVTDEEHASFSLMWRWIARIEGANAELLGETPEEQLAIARHISHYLYQPNADSRAVTAAMLDGLDAMSLFPLNRRLHGAVLRRLMHESVIGALPGEDVPTDLGVTADPIVDATVALTIGGMRVANQSMRIPAVRRAAERIGGRMVDRILDRGLSGREADYRPTPVKGDQG
jgi:hypothetical protein